MHNLISYTIPKLNYKCKPKYFFCVFQNCVLYFLTVLIKQNNPSSQESDTVKLVPLFKVTTFLFKANKFNRQLCFSLRKNYFKCPYLMTLFLHEILNGEKNCMFS